MWVRVSKLLILSTFYVAVFNENGTEICLVLLKVHLFTIYEAIFVFLALFKQVV